MTALYRIIVFSLFIITSNFASGNFYFIIRVDDIQSKINWEPRRITNFEAAVETRTAKISWVVIPHRLVEWQNDNGVLVDDLKNSITKGHEVIVHGYNHICPLCSQSSHEMYCTFYQSQHSYNTQLGMIENSLQILQDKLSVVPKIFVPPGHAADSTTYQILLEKNFEWISTTDSTKKYIYNSLYNLSPHNEFTWSLTNSNYLEKFNSALNDIEAKFQSDGYYCLLLHDPFIRRGYENGLVINWTAELLDSLIARYGDNIKFKTLSETAAIFRDGLTEITHNKPIPQSFSLSQNYPNPFNPTTKIQFTIPATSVQTGDIPSVLVVVLKVYDILGNEVTTLVNEYKPSGIYEVEFSAVEYGLTSGIYFYRLQSGEFSETKKMMLLK
jgi:predicted deacetylase